jgi:nitrogen PTS system EIIA component
MAAEWSMPHTEYSLEDAADYLHLEQSELRELARCGEIPCQRRGDRLVFRRLEIDRWGSRRILAMRDDSLDTYHRTSTRKTADRMPPQSVVAGLFRQDACELFLTAKTRSSAIRSMVALAASTDRVIDPDELLRSVQEREDLHPTCVAGGAAIPHPTHHDPWLFDDSFIAFARAAQPVPYGAADGRMTDLFFLLCCRNDRLHLHALARLCMMCARTTLTEDLRRAGDPADVLEAFNRSEADVLTKMR